MQRSGWKALTTSSSCAEMARSERCPTFSSPVRTATSTSSSAPLDSRRRSYCAKAPKMALVSLSSGSAIPSLRAAVSTFLRLTTGPRMDVLLPRSSSRSTVSTRMRSMVGSDGTRALPPFKTCVESCQQERNFAPSAPSGASTVGWRRSVGLHHRSGFLFHALLPALL